MKSLTGGNPQTRVKNVRKASELRQNSSEKQRLLDEKRFHLGKIKEIETKLKNHK